MALQAKDLMIGDLLTFEGCIKEGSIVSIRVAELHEYDNEFLASIDGDAAYDIMELDDEIVGIPLTPEILEKNGFIKNEDNKYVCSCQIVVPASSKENSPVIQMNFYKDPIAGVNTLLKCWSPTLSDYKGFNEMHLCNLESVHELQHALKLCGIEKQIEP